MTSRRSARSYPVRGRLEIARNDGTTTQVGGLRQTLIGALMIAVLRIAITTTGLDPAYEPLAYGALVIIASALTIDRSRVHIVK
jgi:ribose transport system permease protein